jgi:UDP-glucose 4-epimerase
MNRSILVTGAAGFIGSHLSEALIRKGYRVTGFDNLTYGRMENLAPVLGHPNFEFVQGDVRDGELLRRISGSADAILHLAAFKIPRYSNALQTLDVNSKGTENLLNIASASGCRVVFASTSDVYGKNPHLPYSEKNDFYMGSPQIRRWSYAISKILGEHLCFLYARERGVRVTVLRYFGSYGPRQNLTWWGGPQSIFIDCALRDAPMPMHGDGLQTRSFTFIKDTIEGTVRALENESACEKVFNIGSTEEITILDLGRKIWRLVRRTEEPRIEFIPYRQLPGRYEDVRRRVPDIGLAKEMLGFRPEVTLSEGLIQTIAWQRSVTTEGGLRSG